MTTIARELETKYEPGDGAAIPDLTALDGVATADEAEEDELEAIYFDADGLPLSGAGLTLRRRTGGPDAGWHLKVPVPGGGRDELREPLGGSTADDVPAPLEETVQLYARGRALRPVARVHTRRRVHRLRDAEGRVLAELCDDLVTADTPEQPDQQLTWREWELELVAGDASFAEAADELLLQHDVRRSSSKSKLARVLGNRVPPVLLHPEVEPDATSPAAEICGALLREQLAEIRYRDPLVRGDLPDAVHKLRVATRRLRSALVSYRPLLDRERTDPLREELKWIAGVLGAARDAEVMLEELTSLLADEPGDLVLGAVGERIDRHLRTVHRQAHRRAVEAMSSERYFVLVDALDVLTTHPPWTEAAHRPAAEVLPPRVAKAFRRLRRRVEAVATAADPETRDRHLHEVRKAAKRVRYAAEPLVPVVGRDAHRLVKAAKELQTVLGDYRDAVLTQPVLRQLAVQAHLDGDNAFTYGRLHGRQQARAEELERGFRASWSRAGARKRRRWLS